ncbi:MAG TPA: HemK2/MTQ2 family protein methyltransferase [Candidatus Nanoarchaeia archaeon]|nr:HemK2/MTQ2 family protein methyltransferase [Candidatus Nanoarchaeia archaeon]
MSILKSEMDKRQEFSSKYFLYEPAEDSFLLQKYVKKHAYGRVLDIGAGTGIQALAASQKKNVVSVLGIDVNPSAISYCQKYVQSKSKKLSFLHSDLFASLSPARFDTITFNPPYLPEDKHEPKESSLATTGGKRGYEILERFFSKANIFLKSRGIILLLFSSLTRKNQVERIISENLFKFKELEKIKIPFEELYVYLVKKTDLLKQLEDKKIYSLKYFAQGKRSHVYLGDCKKKKIIVKARKNSAPKNITKKEAGYLRLLNRHRIGPGLLFAKKDFLAEEFVEGKRITEFIAEEKSKLKIKKILAIALDQCFTLDQLHLVKEEMHRPHKHLLISYPRLTMIDFERTHSAKKPHNVTQFVQYILSSRNLLAKKGFKIDPVKFISLAREYKLRPNKHCFKVLINALN